MGGEKYQRVLKSPDRIAADIIANYRIWAVARGMGSPDALDTHSTMLFDTVAVYLAFSQDMCGMERLGIRVTDDGFTAEDPKARKINVALTWKNLAAFLRTSWCSASPFHALHEQLHILVVFPLALPGSKSPGFESRIATTRRRLGNMVTVSRFHMPLAW